MPILLPDLPEETPAGDRREAELAQEHRLHEWQPADPARLALGLYLAREGKTVTADEARARFRRNRG